MNKALQYYAMIISKWIPNSPVETFYPFFVTMISEEKVIDADMKQLVSLFEEKFGFQISSFIMHNILIRATKRDICTMQNDLYHFSVENEKKSSLISESLRQSTTNNIDTLIREFVTYCNDSEVDSSVAEVTLVRFVQAYDVDIVAKLQGFSENEKDVYLYFFTEFVKHIYEEKKKLYEILVTVCEGNMIRSILLNEHIDTTHTYEGQMIFLDTPIMLKIFGYYGEFIKNEYLFLLKCWKNQGANIFVYEHTVKEIEHVLMVSSRWVENPDIDISKSSMVTLHFRSCGMTKQDVESELVLIEKNLEQLNINIFSMNVEPLDMFSENEDIIKNRIIEAYTERKYPNFNHEFEDAQYVEYDVKSIFYTYLIRANNTITKLSDAKAIFVTNNHGIISAVTRYHTERYKQTLVPVIKDTYIGMIVVANNLLESKDYVRSNLIAMCYSAYKPSSAIRKTYVDQVNKLKETNRIDNDDFILLKNFGEVSDLLAQKTRGYSDDVSDEILFDVLGEIKAKLVIDERKSSERAMERQKQEHERVVQIEKQKSEETTNNEYLKRLNLAKEDYSTRVKIGTIIYSCIFAIIVTTAILKLILIDLPQKAAFGEYVVTSIFFIFAVIQVALYFFSHSNIIEKLLHNRKNKIAQKYEVNICDIVVIIASNEKK